MRVTLGISGGYWVEHSEDMGQSPEVLEVVLMTEVSQQRMSSWNLCCYGCQKKMLPNTQSIKGLEW